MANFPIIDEIVVELLALPSFAHQMERLVANHLANEAGLTELLVYAEKAARHDPLQTRALTQLCEQAAIQIAASALVPRATYLRAQTYVLRGDADTALKLIEIARSQFVELGMTVDALRTDVGAMNTLTALGRYRNALESGSTALAQIDNALATVNQESAAALELIRAKIHDNQGPALCEMGRFEEALISYDRAESIFESLQMTEDQVLVLNNRGVALRYLGRVDEALHVYEQAAALLPGAGYLYALMQNNIGDAHLLLGDYQASLAALAEARREFSAQHAEYDLQICTSHMADAYLALNLYPEALALYRGAVESLETTDYHYYLGKALWGIGSIQIALLELDEADAVLTRAVELFIGLDNVPIAAQIMLEQSALLEARGDHTAALDVAQQALDKLDGQGWPVQRIYAHLRLADLLLPDSEEAERHLEQVDTLLQDVGLPHLRFRFLQRIGQVRLLQGKDDEAQQLLEAAIAEIERLRSSLVDEAMLVSFQQDKMAAYEALIQLHLERLAADQNDEEALQRTFDLIERTKSRALVERISGVVRAHVLEKEDTEGEDQQTRDRLRRIQSSLNAIYSDMLGHDSGTLDDRTMSGDRTLRMRQLGERATELEQDLTQVRLQLAAHQRASEPFEQPLPLHEIQANMPDDLKIVSYHIAGDEILAFVFTHDAIQVFRKISSTSTVQNQLDLLAAQWNHLRARSVVVERHIARFERNAQHLLHQLYLSLLAPLEQLLGLDVEVPAGKLVIVPHGLLHQAPFQALYDGERYLIEKAEISFALSATIHALCQQRQPRQSDQLLVLGVSDPAIPAVEAEALSIAQVLPRADLFLDEKASLETLSANVSACRVLHLACHGLFRTDNPMFSALKLHDGWLTAADSSLLDLDGAVVVLSACESGRGAVLAGDETMGLTRAFLGAGAATLVVSQWLVQDDTGAMLMAEWYARLARGQNSAAALRGAQLAIKRSHPHPYYWAPFVLIGSRSAIFDE